MVNLFEHNKVILDTLKNEKNISFWKLSLINFEPIRISWDFYLDIQLLTSEEFAINIFFSRFQCDSLKLPEQKKYSLAEFSKYENEAKE